MDKLELKTLTDKEKQFAIELMCSGDKKANKLCVQYEVANRIASVKGGKWIDYIGDVI